MICHDDCSINARERTYKAKAVGKSLIYLLSIIFTGRNGLILLWIDWNLRIPHREMHLEITAM